MTFSTSIAVAGILVVLVAAALVWLKRHKPDLYNRIAAAVGRKSTDALQPRPAPAASIAAVVPPAAETPVPSGTAAPGAEPTAPSAVRGTPIQPAVSAATKEASMSIEDKGVVTAGELLSGWVLANWETKTDPVPAQRHADLMYLTQMSRKPGGNMVFEDVVIGSQYEVNICKNYAHANGWEPMLTYDSDGKFHDWSAEATPAVRSAAEASIVATKAGWAARGIRVPTYDFSRYYRR